jgi:D-alanine-D-alanine ligase
MKKKLFSITVLFNKCGENKSKITTESELDTWDSAIEVEKVLNAQGFETDLLGINAQDIANIKKIKSDLVFNLIEWTGEDTLLVKEVFGQLDKLGIPYTGSDLNGYLLSVDKIRMKRLFDKLNIPTPRWQVFEPKKKFGTKAAELIYPVILKPAYEHCGVGITTDSVVADEVKLKEKVTQMLERFAQPIIAEEYIAGRELHVTVLEKNGQPWVLPLAEVAFSSHPDFLPILTYDAKWKEKTSEYQLSKMVVADVPVGVKKSVEKIASTAYRKMGGRDYPRLDMRLRGEEIWVLEINNNPGIDYDQLSGIGVSARAAGMTYEELLKHVVENAYLRFNSERRYGTIGY